VSVIAVLAATLAVQIVLLVLTERKPR